MKTILEELRKAVLDYDPEGAANCAKKAMSENMEPLEALDALTQAIRDVGDRFGKGELWLPDLVGAADAMQAATPIIEEELERTGAKRTSLGVVVLGTVFGDIHNIGKDMVGTLLTAAGFDVKNLGVDVRADEFMEAIMRYKADILAMSALLTTTAPEQRKVIEMLKAEKMRDKVKVMVGGGSITHEFARNIGADGYEPTAPGAVDLALKLLGGKEGRP